MADRNDTAIRILAVLTALGVSLWLQRFQRALSRRPVHHSLVQLWMFVSPVIYSIDNIPKAAPCGRSIGINPMTGVIGGFRWALYGKTLPGGYLWLSVGVVIVLFVGGLYFKRMERVFADVV